MTDVDPPFQLAAMAPRRRPRWLVPLLAGLAVVVLAAGAVVAYAATREDPARPGTAPATSAASVVLLSEHDACVRLNPLLRRSSEMYAAFTKDGVTPTGAESEALHADLRAVRKVAPADMGSDIDQVIKGVVLLSAGGKGVDFQDWQNAGLSLATRCFGA